MFRILWQGGLTYLYEMSWPEARSQGMEKFSVVELCHYLIALLLEGVNK